MDKRELEKKAIEQYNIVNGIEPEKKPTINIDIENIIYVGKWKFARPIVEGMINGITNRKHYKRNQRIIVYIGENKEVGTMIALDGCNDADSTKAYLQGR